VFETARYSVILSVLLFECPGATEDVDESDISTM